MPLRPARAAQVEHGLAGAVAAELGLEPSGLKIRSRATECRVAGRGELESADPLVAVAQSARTSAWVERLGERGGLDDDVVVARASKRTPASLGFELGGDLVGVAAGHVDDLDARSLRNHVSWRLARLRVRRLVASTSPRQELVEAERLPGGRRRAGGVRARLLDGAAATIASTRSSMRA